MTNKTQEVLSPCGIKHSDLPDLMKTKKNKLKNIMTELTPLLPKNQEKETIEK